MGDWSEWVFATDTPACLWEIQKIVSPCSLCWRDEAFVWFLYGKLVLKKHSDRPSCEISVTASIDSDGTEWPIYMDGNPVYLEPGEAAIYLGQEVEHWRDEFKGDYASQVFMHYVDRDGPHTDYYKDKRDLYGIQAPL